MFMNVDIDYYVLHPLKSTSEGKHYTKTPKMGQYACILEPETASIEVTFIGKFAKNHLLNTPRRDVSGQGSSVSFPTDLAVMRRLVGYCYIHHQVISIYSKLFAVNHHTQQLA